MFDIGFTELLLIGVVALIVVGPKDLPGMFRTLGRFTARARQMGREFSRAMSDAADESGIKDVGDTLKKATSPTSTGLDALNKAADNFEKWDPSKSLKETPKAKDTSTLSDERAEAARKIQEATSKKATERLAKEAEAEAAPKDPASKKAAPKKPTAKKPATKKATAKTPAAKKTTKASAKPTDTSDA